MCHPPPPPPPTVPCPFSRVPPPRGFKRHSRFELLFLFHATPRKAYSTSCFYRLFTQQVAACTGSSPFPVTFEPRRQPNDIMPGSGFLVRPKFSWPAILVLPVFWVPERQRRVSAQPRRRSPTCRPTGFVLAEFLCWRIMTGVLPHAHAKCSPRGSFLFIGCPFGFADFNQADKVHHGVCPPFVLFDSQQSFCHLSCHSRSPVINNPLKKGFLPLLSSEGLNLPPALFCSAPRSS